MLGGGNGGLALAGELALAGFAVRLFEHPRFFAGLAGIRDDSQMVLVDAAGERRQARLALVTDRLDDALEGVELVHLVVPVSAQEVYFGMLLPRLSREQVVVLWAGRFGTLRFRKLAGAAGIPAAASRAVEINTLPYGCRRIGPAEVRIAFRTVKLFAAGVPRAGTEDALEALAGTFPELEAVESPIEVALRNSSMLVLGVGPLLNMGAIETRGQHFALFRDGMTPAVRAVVKAAHGEFIAVGRGWGLEIPWYDDAVYEQPTSVEGANFRDTAGGHEGFALLTGPDRLDHRYTVENVRYGFALVAALGRAAGVATPILDGLTALADAALGPAFARTGWRLDDLELPVRDCSPAGSRCV